MFFCVIIPLHMKLIIIFDANSAADHRFFPAAKVILVKPLISFWQANYSEI